MTAPSILTDLTDNILTITLNRPEALNAYSYQMHDELMVALTRADEDDEVRAVILTGSGRAYCAGMDLSAGVDTFNRRAIETIDEHRDGGGELTLKLFDLRKPVIAAINGAATGVGITMTLAADIRLASSNAKMGFVFAQRGIAPDACSSWFAPRIVGVSRALEWFLSGRVFGAEEALAARLVSEVLEPAALMPRARALAGEIVTKTSAVSVAIVRRLLWRMLGADGPHVAFAQESKALWYMGGASDVREGVTSFFEKRPAEFTMKVSTDFPDFLE